jgi:hypothetical protein
MSSMCDVVFRERLNIASVSLEARAAYSTWALSVQTQLIDPSGSASIDFLKSIPDTDGYLSIAALAWLLSQRGIDLSTFDIIRCYNKLWTALPEAAKAGQDEHAGKFIQDAVSHVTSSISSLSSLFLSDSDLPALIDPINQRTMTHQQLFTFVRNFRLPLTGTVTSSKPVVVLALPNGPLLGLACLAVSSYYTAVPLNISGGPHQFKSDVGVASPKAILVLDADIQKLGLHEAWVKEAGIQLLVAQPQVDMTFQVLSLTEEPTGTDLPATPNSGDDIALLLFTSGTSGTKKVVVSIFDSCILAPSPVNVEIG